MFRAISLTLVPERLKTSERARLQTHNDRHFNTHPQEKEKKSVGYFLFRLRESPKFIGPGIRAFPES